MLAKTYKDVLLSDTAKTPLIRKDPDTLLGRFETADALTEAGFRTSPATLATKASRGGGPPFRRWGRIPLYRWGDSLDWARSRLGPPMRSTSEADGAPPAPARAVGHAGDFSRVQPPAEIVTGARAHRTPSSDGRPGAAPPERARSRREKPAAG
jgi:hypothetical protein